MLVTLIINKLLKSATKSFKSQCSVKIKWPNPLILWRTVTDLCIFNVNPIQSFGKIKGLFY